MQIHQGNYEIGQRDQTVCDHHLAGKHCETPDQVGPPLSYMEECRVFKPTESINNPMGLCRFYRMSPKKSNVLTGPKSAECAHRIYGMVEIAKRVGQQLTVVLFDGESCLTHVSARRVAFPCGSLTDCNPHMPGEADVGAQNHMYCCPICAYVVKIDMAPTVTTS